MKQKRSPAIFLISTILGLLLPGAARAQEQSAGESATRTLYLANCAPCHGETGDGKGTTVLDRPARSFLDGGFSYGNTPEALYRSITTGIPGTPMPSFEAAIPEDARRALAEFVRALGPADLIVDTSDKVLVVADEARLARGKLPPIVEGVSERPRGLLIGLPAGTSFEYRIDDVRLLGVRQGEFVERRDWVGRGGDFLQPLGQLIHTQGAGNPSASFIEFLPRDPSRPLGIPSGEERELLARLVSSYARGQIGGLEMSVSRGDGSPYLRVEEEVQSLRTTQGSGWIRRFRYRGGSVRARVLHRFASDDPPESRQAAFAQVLGEAEASSVRQWQVFKRAQGGWEARALQVKGPAGLVRSTSASALWLEVSPESVGEAEVLTLLLPAWSAEIQAQLLREVLQQ